jgi:hypothetical protein
MMTRIFVTGWAALLIAGCSHNDMMSDYIGSFDDHITAVRADVSAHGSAVAASDGSSMGTLEDVHYARMLNHMTGMNYDINNMSACYGGTPTLATDMDDMQRECSDHRISMANAADVTVARAEEARHQTAMSNLFVQMQMQSRSMMDGLGSYDCSHCMMCGH